MSTIPSDIGKMHVSFYFIFKSLNWTYSVRLCRAEPLVRYLGLKLELFLVLLIQRTSLSNYPKASWTPSAVVLIWCTFCSSLWVGDFCFIDWPAKIFFRYLLLGVFGRPSSMEGFSVWSVCCRNGSGNFNGENGVHRICCWFWKLWGHKWCWPPLACRAGNEFCWYVSSTFGPLSFTCLQVDYIVAAVVQICYAYRIKVITGSYIIPIVVVLVKFHLHPSSVAYY